MGIFQGHTFISLKHLDNGLVFIKLYDTAEFLFIVVYNNLYDFFKGGILHAFQNDQRAVDLVQA